MKIVFLEAVQNFGGSKRSVVDMAEQLISLGHDVLVVDFWGANKEFISALQSKYVPFKILDPKPHPFVIRGGKGLARSGKILEYFWRRRLYKRKFKELARSFKPDYVCVNSFKALDILCRNELYKIDYYVRGWGAGTDYKARFYFNKYRPRFIAVSEATRHAIFLQNKVPMDRIEVVKSAVGCQPFNMASEAASLMFNKNHPIVLMHAGTFVYTKGHHVSILIADSLKKKNIHFKMKIAGLVSAGADSKKYYLHLRKMVSDLGLEEWVEFIVDNHDLASEMDQAHVFLNPSYTEGLPRVCLEAMSRGKPVITNAVGGVTDVVISGFSGYLVGFNNVNHYVDSVVTYYSDAECYQRHSQNSLRIINSGYLQDHLKESLNKVYGKL